MAITIYHNPTCGTSRNTLAMIRASGVEPTIIDYLTSPPDRTRLQQLITAAGLTVRDALREKEAPALGLDLTGLSDAALLGAMLAHPVLLNRPFVVTSRGTALCRPSELVLNILENPDIGPFTKEDGEVVPPAQG